MSLYYDAAAILDNSGSTGGSLKTRVFGAKTLKCPPKQVFALLSEATKWSSILTDIIEKSRLLHLEHKLSPSLALLLVHDLLLTKRGISAPSSHALRLAVTKHKVRLSAEFTRARLRKGFHTIESFTASINSSRILDAPTLDYQDGSQSAKAGLEGKIWPHPRWIRINTLKTSLKEQLAITLTDYTKVDSMEELLAGRSTSIPNDRFYLDQHIPNLIALPDLVNLSNTSAYRDGSIIIQDKASCFPAYLLDHSPDDGDCLDACAAPGNKTTHIAALIHERSIQAGKPKIWACERNGERALTLQSMISIAGADELVTIKAGQDFLRLNPEAAPWKNVGSLLLDPSCSGSGIVGRDESVRTVLPSKREEQVTQRMFEKRKPVKAPEPTQAVMETKQEPQGLAEETESQIHTRLQALSTFQLRLLLHAFRFPAAHKITYSTCSIYAEENEHVVVKALNSEEARRRGWKILSRVDQISGMKAWPIRGDVVAAAQLSGKADVFTERVAEACIRCEKGTKEGTQGFFVAAFQRQAPVYHGKEDRKYESGNFGPELENSMWEDEWQGFENEEA